MQQSSLFDNDPYLEYDDAAISRHYPRVPKLAMVSPRTGALVFAPYFLDYDYREHPEWATTWGECTVLDEEYHLPKALHSHRDLVRADMQARGKVRGVDRICARVHSWSGGKEERLHCRLQFALYSDQIATNLATKWRFDPPLVVGGTTVFNPREWEARILGLDGTFAPLEQSLLANTLGVAVGMWAPTDSGDEVLLMRRRSESMAVYPGMMHVPFSFALNLERGGVLPFRSPLRTVIGWDFSEEHAQEVKVERELFEPVRALAFCRDLVRAAKPQMFLEVRSRITYEELRSRTTGVSDEYVGELQALRIGEELPHDASPELVAHAILTQMGSRPSTMAP